MATDFQSEIHRLQQQLETERNDLAFCKLSLEDESEKVELGVQVIRKLTEETERLNAQQTQWKADRELIQQMQSQIEKLENENKEMKRITEETQNFSHAQSTSFQIEKKATEGVIDILRLQVQQASLEAQKLQDMVQQSTELVPNSPQEETPPKVEPPSSRKKSQLLLEKTRTNLDQCLEEIGLTPTSNMKLNSKLSDYHRAIQNHTQVLIEEIDNSKQTIDQLKVQLSQERENGTMLLEIVESLQQQVTCLSSQESKVIEISVLVPEVKMKFGSVDNHVKQQDLETH